MVRVGDRVRVVLPTKLGVTIKSDCKKHVGEEGEVIQVGSYNGRYFYAKVLLENGETKEFAGTNSIGRRELIKIEETGNEQP